MAAPADPPVALLAPDAAPAAGRDFDAGAGLRLSLHVPAGRRLARADLALAATSDAALAPAYPALVADSGPMAGKTDAPWQWASADWGETRALVGVTLDIAPPSAGALTPPRKTGARLRVACRGNWLPLQPLDTLPAGDEQRIPAQCASRLTAEMLIEGDAAEKRTGVLIPGTVTGRRIGLRFTAQPCLVEVAVDDDPPFFAPDGPLPASPVAVAGLARAINRYLADHPGRSVVPLLLRAANRYPLRISAFTATLEPLPEAATPPAPPAAPAAPDAPRPGERPLLPPAAESTRIARLCSPRHTAAAALAPLPAHRHLSSVALWLRVQGDAASGQLALHADAGGVPAEPPLVRWPWDTRASPDEAPGWLTRRLPAPLAGTGQPCWLVCQVEHGALLWYADAARPAGAGGALFRQGGGPWLPLDGPGHAPWLQCQAGVLDDAPATD